MVIDFSIKAQTTKITSKESSEITRQNLYKGHKLTKVPNNLKKSKMKLFGL